MEREEAIRIGREAVKYLTVPGWAGGGGAPAYAKAVAALVRLAEADAKAESLGTHRAEPAFRCERCGQVGYFAGPFSAWRFEVQARRFAEQHESCPATFQGGGI